MDSNLFTILASVVIFLTLILLLVFSATTLFANNDEFETIKKRVLTELMKSSVDDAQVEQILEKATKFEVARRYCMCMVNLAFLASAQTRPVFF